MTRGDYYVFLSEPEAERIRNYLQLSRGWFRRRYLERLEDGELVAAAGGGDRCIFLDAAGQCRVYPVRPGQCRTYPFWPEVAGSALAWRKEARRCEGINRGAVVPVDKIRRAVRACSDQQP
jgi:Fe-S-cluster containining protein